MKKRANNISAFGKMTELPFFSAYDPEKGPSEIPHLTSCGVINIMIKSLL